MMEDGRYARFYKPRSYKFTNKWLVRPCSVPYNVIAELCLPPIMPPIVLPEPSRHHPVGSIKRTIFILVVDVF
jgi:hypothetical protein